MITQKEKELVAKLLNENSQRYRPYPWMFFRASKTIGKSAICAGTGTAFAAFALPFDPLVTSAAVFASLGLIIYGAIHIDKSTLDD